MKKSVITLLLVGYFGLFFFLLLGLGYSSSRTKLAPEQPIAFSHKIHAGKLKLACTECHTSVEKSPRAGVPPVEKCMSCHKTVAVEKPEVQKIHRYWEDREPIPWSRVYSVRVRNYVYFSHKRHIKKGVDCSACHGDVKNMERIRKVSSLNMGWCVSCHRQKQAPTDCLICHK